MAKKFKYDWSEFTLKAAVKASPSKVFKLWADEKEICKWFLSGAKIDLRKGGEYEWTWLPGFTDKGKFLNVRKNSNIRFTFAGSICDVSFKKDKRGCLIVLRQYKIPTDERNKVGTYLSCSLGWSFFLANLKSVIEHKADLRERDPKHLKEGTVFY